VVLRQIGGLSGPPERFIAACRDLALHSTGQVQALAMDSGFREGDLPREFVPTIVGLIEKAETFNELCSAYSLAGRVRTPEMAEYLLGRLETSAESAVTVQLAYMVGTEPPPPERAERVAAVYRSVLQREKDPYVYQMICNGALSLPADKALALIGAAAAGAPDAKLKAALEEVAALMSRGETRREVLSRGLQEPYPPPRPASNRLR